MAVLALRRPFRMRVSALGYRVRSRLARWGRAWRYARGTWTEDDADYVAYECAERSGSHPLEWVSVGGVMERLLDQYEDSPVLRGLAETAAARVASKWDGDGEAASSAIDWAVELVEEYARQDGVVLVPLSDEPDE